MDRRDMLVGLGVAGSLAGASISTTAVATPPRTKAVSPPTDEPALFVREWGAGRPVVFTHSLGLSSEIWNSQVLHLAALGYRCITYDRRGHGRSSVPGGGYEMDRLADDLARVIEGVAAPQVALVGHSMGSGEILRYLARHGTERVSKIALLAPTTPYLKEAPDNPGGLPDAGVEALHAAWARDFPAWVEANKAPFFVSDTSRPMMDWLTGLMLQTPLPVILACNQAMIETDHRPGLAQIDHPVLILHGDRDVSAPLDLTGRRTAAGIRNAVLKVYEGAPHGLFVTHADRVNDDLAAFLGSN